KQGQQGQETLGSEPAGEGMTLTPAKKKRKPPFFRRKNERITNVFEGAMCRWHMISTDRSGAQTWKHEVRSDPVTTIA
ncbi:MAG: hypothetical protein Q3X72_06335, partial [Candidatus Copromonas sp.]|nr:hypothetical protein [Candidatus Copromonas sp.]